MPYSYPAVDKLQNKPLVGSGTCVDLIKLFVPGLIGKSTAVWRAGVNVMEAQKAGKTIRRGTAIATFDKSGRYPQICGPNYRGSCHHAGLVLEVRNGGFWIMDQYTGDDKRLFVSRRFIRIRQPSERYLANGAYADAGNNALAFYVIEQ